MKENGKLKENTKEENAAIGEEEIARAVRLLEKYREGKRNLERRIIDNEQWFKLRHWEQAGKSANPGDPEPTSAWLLNCIAN